MVLTVESHVNYIVVIDLYILQSCCHFCYLT